MTRLTIWTVSYVVYDWFCVESERTTEMMWLYVYKVRFKCVLVTQDWVCDGLQSSHHIILCLYISRIEHCGNVIFVFVGFRKEMMEETVKSSPCCLMMMRLRLLLMVSIYTICFSIF